MSQVRAHPADPALDSVAGVLALLASLAQVAAAFLTWTSTGFAALDLSLVSTQDPTPPTIGMVLIALAALPAVAVLRSRRGWPRVVSALGTGALVLGWLGTGPDAALVDGVWVAIGATVGHLVAAALAD